jgi:branched-chain amino acid transport system ATP-binding protein
LQLLELRDVHAHYGATTALRGVSLAVEPGDFVAIVGPNGAGKTTTLRAISGTVKTSGEVFMDGERVGRRTPESMAKRGVAHLPTRGGTFPALTVLDNLRLGAWVQRAPSTRDLAHVFEFFPVLYDRRGQRAGALTAGEQQMLAVGRALMGHPRLLLVDEPSVGAAPGLLRPLFEVLQRLNEGGAAVVLVEQNAAVALSAARRAYVLSSGRVVRDGNSADLAADESLRSAYLEG